jgi:hypothetical protein
MDVSRTFVKAGVALVAALLAGACSATRPSPAPTSPSSGPDTAKCSALKLPFETTRSIDRVVSTPVSVAAGLRVSPPDASGHAGDTVATLSPGVQVLVCGNYVRPSDGKVTWKGVVLLDPSDARISWEGPKQPTGWVLAEKL